MLFFKNIKSGQNKQVLSCIFRRYVILTICMVLSGSGIAQSSDVSRPNIIYILADDLGIGDISSYNENSRLQTSNVDRLAANGIKFTDAHTSSSVCTPTRYGILTGRYSWRSRLKKGVLSGYSKALIEPDRLTVAQFLKDHGYHTGFIGKWHLGWDWKFVDNPSNIDNLDSRPTVDFTQPITNGPTDKGFSYAYAISGSLDMAPYVFVENDLPTSIPTRNTVSTDFKGFWREGPTGDDFEHAEVLQHLTHKALDYIRNRVKKENPFFLYFALPAPHTPILPTSPFLGKSNTNFYGDFVLQMDDVVGQIITLLEEQNILDNTLIVFTSDNGCSPRAGFDELAKVGHNPNYIYRGHKADLYEGGHRVPFILSWPNKVKKGVISNELICTTDLLATLSELLNAPLPEDAGEDSYSILPFLDPLQAGNRPERAIVHHSVEGRFAIRKGNWKLILWPGSGGWSSPRTGRETENLPPYQLYDLNTDPGEQNNLFHQHPEIVRELERLFVHFVRNGRSTPGKTQSQTFNTWMELTGIGDF